MDRERVPAIIVDKSADEDASNVYIVQFAYDLGEISTDTDLLATFSNKRWAKKWAAEIAKNWNVRLVVGTSIA